MTEGGKAALFRVRLVKMEPEKIADELVAQMKFINVKLAEAEQALMERRGAKFIFHQYLASAYNLVDGDHVTPEGLIIRVEESNQ